MLTLEQQNYAYNAYLKTMEYLRKPKSIMNPEFTSNCAMYVFTSENLNEYIKKLKPAGKDILTVTGSGDQLINLALSDGRRVDNFDINQNTYFMTQLKIAALKALDYDEFLNFFCSCDHLEMTHLGITPFQKSVEPNDLVFDFKTYLRIRPYLEDTSAFFWNLIYEDFQFDGKKLSSSALFYDAPRREAISNNEYLQSEENYNKARENINQVEINFMECNLLDVHTLTSTYDIILFSNIYEYLTDEWYSVISEEAFVNYIKEQVSPRLNEDGVIAVAYQYNYKTKNFANKGLINRILGKGYTLDPRLPLENMKKVIVSSTVQEYRENGNKDCIYLYEKGKTK